MPDHWHLCQVPIDGTLVSSSVELMRLGVLLPPVLHESLERIGWSANEVDHYVFHQPSEVMVRKLLESAGADPARAVYTHSTHGNCASANAAIPVTLAWHGVGREAGHWGRWAALRIRDISIRTY